MKDAGNGDDALATWRTVRTGTTTTHMLDAKLAFNKHKTSSSEVQQTVQVFANRTDEIAKHVPSGYKHTINKDTVNIGGEFNQNQYLL